LGDAHADEGAERIFTALGKIHGRSATC
jgi:hypothetical protein